MENSAFIAFNSGLLSWRVDIHICICILAASFFALKHLIGWIGWILLRSFQASILKNATECIASSLDIHEKRTSPDGHIQYDVFINYQNNEISANRFVDNLYEVLRYCGVRAFVKSTEGEEEEVLDGRTKHAISTAKLHLAIFSKEYARSPKCLSELYEMVKNGKKVFPLFFDVEPSDARWIKRSYAEAFQRHGRQQRFHIETLNNWKDALHAVSLITGWELAQFKGQEGKLLKKVVQDVLKEVNDVPLEVAKFPVGLSKRVEKLEALLLSNPDGNKATVVGIVGMGGVGKTTLAKAVYNRIRSNFRATTFLHDVKELIDRDGLTAVQEIILTDLLRFDCKIRNIDEGKVFLRRRLNKAKNILIVLDNVDNFDQLDALMVTKVLGPSCRVLVTTRVKRILELAQISMIYEATRLNKEQATELFCRHAFLSARPHLGFDDLVLKFVEILDGLPLSVETFGSHLYGKADRKIWEVILGKISRILPWNIKERLKITVEVLDEEEKSMFLDAACYLVGEGKDTAIRIWDASGWSGWLGFETLEQKCLIQVDPQNRIRMHDHLRDIGKDIIDQESKRFPGRRSRLWRPTDIIKVLRENSGTEAVRGLSFVSRSSNLSPNSEAGVPTTWQAESLSQMKDLKLLLLQGTSFEGDFSQFSKNLVWLRWWDFPYQSLPPNLPVGKLEVLDLARGRVVKLWDEDDCSQLPLNLRELNLTECNQLQRVPKEIGQMRVLQKIVFKRCRLLTTLPEEFSDLHFLEHLDLTNCRSLGSLPNDFGALKHLRHLDLSFCSKLKTLPDSFSQLLLIKYLTFEKCKILNIGPNILGKSTSLEHLDFRGCDKLQVLPCNISSQRHLKRLNIHCRGLKQLPEDLGELIGLKYLILECPQITQIPDSIGNLIHLEYIDFRSSRLRHVPESVGRLKLLKQLRIICHRLSYLPNAIGQLNNLQSLFLVGCKALQNLPPSFENLTKLVTLDIYDAPNLRITPGILDGLKSLEALSLSGCQSLAEGCIISLCQKAEALESLTLRKMEVENCLRILEHTCSSLKTLEVYACKNLVRAEICSTILTEVKLKHCLQLRTISGFSADMRLTKLCLRNCPELSEVTNLGDLHSLETLDITGCSKLFSKEGFHLLKQLEVLDISVTHETLQIQCEWLQKLPSPRELRISADSVFLDPTKGLSHLLKPFHRMEKEKDGHGLEFKIPADIEMPCAAVIICFVSSRLVNDRDDREIMLEFYLQHDKRIRPVSYFYTKNAELIHLHMLSADIFWVRVMRSGDVIIIRPSKSMNDVPMMLEEGWAHIVRIGEEFEIDYVRNAFLEEPGKRYESKLEIST